MPGALSDQSTKSKLSGQPSSESDSESGSKSGGESGSESDSGKRDDGAVTREQMEEKAAGDEGFFLSKYRR